MKSLIYEVGCAEIDFLKPPTGSLDQSTSENMVLIHGIQNLIYFLAHHAVILLTVKCKYLRFVFSRFFLIHDIFNSFGNGKFRH